MKNDIIDWPLYLELLCEIMDITKYYESLAKRRSEIMAEAMADEEAFALHIRSHNFLKDYSTLISVISGEEKILMEQACREYQYSLESALTGRYRHAFSSLRLFFELFLWAIFFSAHNIKLRLWLAGQDDLKWATLVDIDKGLFSHTFLRAYNPELGEYRTQYLNITTKVYRECSEYVHGNPSTHEPPDMAAAYSSEKFGRFHDVSETMRTCFIYSFCARYGKQLPDNEKNKIEQIVLEEFGDISEIRDLFGTEND